MSWCSGAGRSLFFYNRKHHVASIIAYRFHFHSFRKPEDQTWKVVFHLPPPTISFIPPSPPLCETSERQPEREKLIQFCKVGRKTCLTPVSLCAQWILAWCTYSFEIKDFYLLLLFTLARAKGCRQMACHEWFT